MKQIDEIISDKICSLINYMLSKVIKPDKKINKINELTKEDIEKLKLEYDIEGLILDVDETLRKDMKSIPDCNKKWIENLKGKIKIVILSNGNDQNIEKYFKEQDIDYISFANKPLKKNFLKACEKMNLSPEKVLVIGDSVFADIHGGKRNNMKTVLVQNVEER